jgi:hypothetical protein
LLKINKYLFIYIFVVVDELKIERCNIFRYSGQTWHEAEEEMGG